MPAWQNRQPRVQPRKISTAYRSCTVSASGTSGFFGYGHASRSIVVRLCTRNGTSGPVRHDPLDPPVGQVVHVVEARHVDASVRASRSSSSSRPPGQPSAFHSPHDAVISSTASSPSPSTAASMKSAIGSGLNAACPPATTTGSLVGPVGGEQRDAGQVERGQHVGVAELGRERDAEQVEAPTGRCASTVNCGTPCSRISFSRSGQTAYVRSASTSGRSLSTS